HRRRPHDVPHVLAHPPLHAQRPLPDRVGEMAYAKPPREWVSEVGTERVPALAFLELSSISRGLFLTDLVLKKAPVKVLSSQPVSGGKHVLLFVGDVAAVEESYVAALEGAEGTVSRKILIHGVHP